MIKGPVVADTGNMKPHRYDKTPDTGWLVWGLNYVSRQKVLQFLEMRIKILIPTFIKPVHSEMHKVMTKKWSSEGSVHGLLPWEAKAPGPHLTLTLGHKS